MTKLLLLDADVLIDLNSLDLFEKICRNYEVCITKTVYDEARYFKKAGARYAIKLPDEVEIIEDINIKSLLKVERNAKGIMLQIDPGEASSIACLMDAENDIFFCTCDKAAITLISYMDLDAKCVSLESALKKIGIKKNLYPRHLDVNFKKCIKQGKELRIYKINFK